MRRRRREGRVPGYGGVEKLGLARSVTRFVEAVSTSSRKVAAVVIPFK